MSRSRVLGFLRREIREALPPTLFFAGGFTLIELTTQLIMNNYLLRLANFMVAIGAALLVGKAVLVANRLPFLRRFDSAPMIRPILFKTAVYAMAVALVRVLERMVGYWLDGGSFGGFPEFFIARFSWNRFAAIQLWIIILLLLYNALVELNARLGDGELVDLLFKRHATARRPEH